MVIFGIKPAGATIEDWPSYTYPTDDRFLLLQGCYGEERLTRAKGTNKIIRAHDHTGIDIVGTNIEGEPAYAVADGVVIFAEKQGSYGNLVKIQHAGNVETRYAHLQEIDDKIKAAVSKYDEFRKEKDPAKKTQLLEAAKVLEGQEIGKIGKTGGNYGPHLHFEVRVDGKIKDPQEYFGYTLRPTAKDCGYPIIKEMDVDAKRKKQGDEVTVEAAANPMIFTTFGKIEGERATKLYVEEYAELRFNNQKVAGKFDYIDPVKVQAGKQGGKYKFKGEFNTTASYLANLKILNYQLEVVPDGNKSLNIKFSPAPKIKALNIEDSGGTVVADTLWLKGVSKVESEVAPREEGLTLTAEQLEGRVTITMASDPTVLATTARTGTGGTVIYTGAAPSNLEDGSHTAKVEVLDLAGGISDSKQKVFYLDTRPPEFVSITPLETPVQADRLAWRIGVKDDGSGMDWTAGKWKVTMTNQHPARAATGDVSSQASTYTSGGTDTLDIHIGGRANPQTPGGNSTPYYEYTYETSGGSIKGRAGDPVKIAIEVQDKAGNTSRTTLQTVLQSSPTVWEKLDECTVRHGVQSYIADREKYFGMFTGIGREHGKILIVPGISSVQSDSPYLAVDYQGEQPVAMPTLTHTTEKKFLLYQKALPEGAVETGRYRLIDPVTVLRNSCNSSITPEGQREYEIEAPLFRQIALNATVRYDGTGIVSVVEATGRIMDRTASVFTIGGNEYALEGDPGRLERSVPVTQEGKYLTSTKVRLLTKPADVGLNSEWRNEGDALVMDKEVLVSLGVPEIVDLAYEKDSGVFRALIKDQGTALKDLAITYTINGQESEYRLDYETGEFTGLTAEGATGDLTTVLKVKDLAENEAMKSLTVSLGAENGSVVQYSQSSFQNPHQKMVWPSLSCSWNIGGISFGGNEAWRGQHVAPENQNYARESLSRALVSMTRYSPCEGQIVFYYLSEAPVIRDFRYYPEDNEVRAYISDDMTPLNMLSISVDAESFGPNWGTPHGVSFDTVTGLLRIPVSSVEEVLYRFLEVWDQDNNSSTAQLHAIVPHEPPVIAMTYNRESETDPFSPKVTAEITDVGSGVDANLTVFRMDGEVSRNLTWNGTTLRYFDLNPLAEGTHMAVIEATDMAGLTATQSITFDVGNPPRIERFQYRPESRHQAGSPALTATILDESGINPDALSLSIDGQVVPSAGITFRTETGWFAYVPAVQLRPGLHRATLAARDTLGHAATAMIDFTVESEVKTAGLPLSLSRVEVADLRGNNNGLANEGETVYLYLEMANETDRPQRITSAVLRRESVYIAGIAEPAASYPPLAAQDVATNVKPFEVMIGRGLPNLAMTGSLDVPMTLRVTTEEIPEGFDIPFMLPVYSLSPAFSTVSVSIDPVRSPSANAMQIITGLLESKGSAIDRVTAFVNGRFYDARVDMTSMTYSVEVPLGPGTNLVTVEVLNRAGKRATAQTRIVSTRSGLTVQLLNAAWSSGNTYMFSGLYSPSGIAVRSFTLKIQNTIVPWTYVINPGGSWSGVATFDCASLASVMNGNYLASAGDELFAIVVATTVPVTVIMEDTLGGRAQSAGVLICK